MTEVGFQLSAQQERQWMLQPDGPTGRARAVVELPGTLDEEALRAAIEQVVSRHEILRTTFARASAARLPLQVVNDVAAWHWQTDASGAQDWQLTATLVRSEPERHRLVLSAPSVVCDSYGLVLAAAEVLRALAGNPELEEPLQYADYAAWQEEARAEENAGHWTAFADNGASAGQLPLIQTQAPTADSSTSLPLEIDPGWLAALADDCGADIEDTWLALWAIAVARLTGSEHVVLATRIDGRSQDELAHAIGPYVRALPIACELFAGITLQRAIQAVGAARADASRAQDSAPPSVDAPALAGFAFQPLPGLDSAAGLAASVLETEDPADFAPLVLVCSPGGARLVFDSAAPREQAERVASVLRLVVEGVRRSAEADIWAVEVLPRAERVLLLEQLSHGPTARHLSAVHWVFEDHAARTPQLPALACGDVELTYGELNARANQVAHALRECGVQRDSAVAICMDRSVELIIGILGILKAGGAYVPLHPEHPRSRLEFQLADSEAKALLTRTSLAPLTAGFAGDVILLDGDDLTALPASNPDRIGETNDLAYLIYTSGSTGVPKAVAVRHGGLSNYAAAIGSELGLDAYPPLRFGLVTSVTTDLGNTSLFGALTSGGCLELVPVDVALDGDAFANYVSRRPLDVLKITPSHLSGLLATGDGRVLPSTHLVVGGEPFSWDLADQVMALGRCSVTNHYGPTETTIGSLTHRVAAADPARELSRTVPIGKPLAGTEVYVLDGRLAPVLLGAPGELCIGGAGLACGYWANAEETAARFVAHPFSAAEGALLYRTGDLVHFLPGGELEFLGRIDEQVKLRGYRVEPGEVDHVISRLHGIARCATVVRQDDGGEQRLVGYVVVDPSAGVTVGDLRAHAEEHLPDHMVPSAFVIVDAFPLTPSGKLDRAALPAPDTASAASEYVGPRNENESRVCAIWEQTLGLDRVGVYDNFFELGGHSLLATQVIARIRKAFGVQLPLHSLFTSPNVAELTEVLVAAIAATAPQDEADLAALLEELEGLSDEEAQRLLDAERGAGDITG